MQLVMLIRIMGLFLVFIDKSLLLFSNFHYYQKVDSFPSCRVERFAGDLYM